MYYSSSIESLDFLRYQIKNFNAFLGLIQSFPIELLQPTHRSDKL